MEGEQEQGYLLQLTAEEGRSATVCCIAGCWLTYWLCLEHKWPSSELVGGCRRSSQLWFKATDAQHSPAAAADCSAQQSPQAAHPVGESQHAAIQSPSDTHLLLQCALLSACACPAGLTQPSKAKQREHPLLLPRSTLTACPNRGLQDKDRGQGCPCASAELTCRESRAAPASACRTREVPPRPPLLRPPRSSPRRSAPPSTTTPRGALFLGAAQHNTFTLDPHPSRLCTPWTRKHCAP
jgi:hypothetical protein